MTSTEFAAKYRLLKNVAMRGARTFLAQQVELGRMVMVHYLDAESDEQRNSMLIRLQALQPPTRDKLLEIAHVDGVPVAVTLFITSFTDFAAWLDLVSPPLAAIPPAAPIPAPTVSPAAGDFTSAFASISWPPVAGAPQADRPAPRALPPEPAPVREAPAGEFTRMFGKLDMGSTKLPLTEPTSPAAATAANGVANADEPMSRDDVDAPTLIIEPMKPRSTIAAPPPTSDAVSPHSAPTPAPASPAPQEASFTSVFGKQAVPMVGRPSPALSANEPAAPAPPSPPPASAVAPKLAPPSAQSSAPGEFTQLFQSLSASGNAAFGSEVVRPLDAMPHADVAPPSSPPRMAAHSFFGAPLSAPPTVPPASFGGGSIAPPSLTPSTPNDSPAPSFVSPSGPGPASMPSLPTPNPAAPPFMGAAAPPSWSGSTIRADESGPSEFTRILGRVATAPQKPAPPPAAPSAPTAGAEQGGKSYLPLIIALNVVLVATIGIVVYLIRK
jgi:hypothetical protein